MGTKTRGNENEGETYRVRTRSELAGVVSEWVLTRGQKGKLIGSLDTRTTSEGDTLVRLRETSLTTLRSRETRGREESKKLVGELRDQTLERSEARNRIRVVGFDGYLLQRRSLIYVRRSRPLKKTTKFASRKRDKGGREHVGIKRGEMGGA